MVSEIGLAGMRGGALDPTEESLSRKIHLKQAPISDSSLGGGSTGGGGQEGKPLVPIVQHDVEIGARQLTTGRGNQCNHFYLREIRLQPTDHFLSRFFGRRVADDKNIDILNRDQNPLCRFVVC